MIQKIKTRIQIIDMYATVLSDVKVKTVKLSNGFVKNVIEFQAKSGNNEFTAFYYTKKKLDKRLLNLKKGEIIYLYGSYDTKYKNNKIFTDFIITTYNIDAKYNRKRV